MGVEFQVDFSAKQSTRNAYPDLNYMPPHPFEKKPHATLLGLSFPTLISLIAEPLTGLVDTAFVARLGAPSLAALGVGTVLLSGVFWIFNFLGIGTQTEVAQTFGQSNRSRQTELVSMALIMAGLFGLLMLMVGVPLTPYVATSMGASGEVLDPTIIYVRIRLWGAPAVLITMVVFGAMRGIQDMSTPLWIALGVNGLNILLDGLLIFGWGGFPELGIAGAAWASVISQWLGASVALLVLWRRTGFSRHLIGKDIKRLLVIGGDLFVRTGLLTAFLLVATRAATKMGADSGAAHQAIRQFWIFSALLLDAFAVTGQSLIGYFIGSNNITQALRVARYVCGWSLGTGVFLAVVMIAGESIILTLLVPASAAMIFSTPWFIASIFQPINALSFATDGIHWGTGDFRYLRNAVMVASICGGVAIFMVPTDQPNALALLWWITGGWICIRAAFGILRIWPGVGNSPFGAG